MIKKDKKLEDFRFYSNIFIISLRIFKKKNSKIIFLQLLPFVKWLLTAF